MQRSMVAGKRNFPKYLQSSKEVLLTLIWYNIMLLKTDLVLNLCSLSVLVVLNFGCYPDLF